MVQSLSLVVEGSSFGQKTPCYATLGFIALITKAQC